MDIPNYYEILGVSRDAQDSEIKKAYFQAALKWHPDKNPNNVEVATEKFKQIAEANEILRDPQQRAAYDNELDHPRQAYTGQRGGGGGFWGFGGFGFGFAPRQRQQTPEEQAWEKARQERAQRAYEKACAQRAKEEKEDAEARERRRVRDAEKAAKLKAYREEIARKRAEQEALQRAEEERKREKEAEAARLEAAEKKKRQEEKELAKQARQRFRALVTKTAALQMDPDELQEFLLAKSATELNEMAGQIDAHSASHDARDTIQGFLDTWKSQQAAAREEQQRLRQQKAEAAKALEQRNVQVATRQWTTAELAVFAKACVQIPGGAAARWQSIRDVLAHEGYERSEKECAAKAQELKSMPAQHVLPCDDRVQTNAKASKADAEKPKASSKTDTTTESEEWTSEQQKALESALVQYPASLPSSERWAKIAEAVPGRTKKECVARFKWIREQVMAAKQSGQRGAA